MADVSLALAQARVDDDVELEKQAPAEARVRAGRPVRLRYAYRFEERSADEESWRFRFTIRVGQGEDLVAERSHEDRRARIDDTVANLHHDVTFPAGTHEVRFVAEASVVIRDWHGTTKAKRIEKKVTGKLRVVAD